jgi:hypothetical protein
MFASTLPQNLPEPPPPPHKPVLRTVDLDSLADDAPATRLSDLSASLLQDLQRFGAEGAPRTELIEVLAACVRHTQALDIVMRYAQRTLSLTVFPLDKLAHSVVPMAEFVAGDLARIDVLQVEPARIARPGPRHLAADSRGQFGALATLMWEAALRGSRDTLLPELAGQAAYRIAPGALLHGLRIPGAMANSIVRLRRQTCNLREIAEWPGLNVPRATRLINALYLQSALIVSRTHPAATNEGWSGYR